MFQSNKGCPSIITPQPSEDASVVTPFRFETTPIAIPSIRYSLSVSVPQFLSVTVTVTSSNETSAFMSETFNHLFSF